MADFTEKMRLKGKAAEDIYFAELDKKLIQALHEKQAKKIPPESEKEQVDNMKRQDNNDTSS